jgi:hypothetical protein
MDCVFELTLSSAIGVDLSGFLIHFTCLSSLVFAQTHLLVEKNKVSISHPIVKDADSYSAVHKNKLVNSTTMKPEKAVCTREGADTGQHLVREGTWYVRYEMQLSYMKKYVG